MFYIISPQLKADKSIIADETFKVSKSNIRGDIYDRNGKILATSVMSTSLSLNPNKIKNKKNLSVKLANILNLDQVKLEKKLNSNKKFIWIKRNITPSEH